ncbi:transposase [Paenibacillus sp. FSL H8-0548]|uniref:transposase n=1 Tax=Paenibacillus sp. FSL H8-0548 TaxID=1920422 RepID=UPI00096D8F24|nr:transposase [Paenibacillus sp. FSL H8-0548]OMF36902.1 transposase [Paenibacillus sp. FSL H8-0548]
MGESRQRYSEDFKEKTVQYIQEQTKSVPQIAEELNIPAGTLHQWLAKHRKFENEPLVDREAIRQKDYKIEEQATEIEDLKEEIAILKKAMHIFSKERN